jgi:serine/threonine-protein kinase
LIDLEHEGRQHIDRYELVAEIASGGMATVFLARLSGVGGFQRFVAIKRLHPHLANESEFVDMFLDEARLAAGIHHPNVVPILEVGASERGYYLVMEYVEGDTLARLLARAATQGNRLPPGIAIRIVLDTLAGLHAAHEQRDETGQPTALVHRDVSPQNVLVGSDGHCRITDFGVARAATRLSGTRVGQLKGKIAYMAPEQAMGLSDIDRRADVFAAGIVLWEVLAGKRLFKAVNEAATLSRVLSEQIPELTSVAPDVEPELAAVAMKALNRDKDTRFSTAAQFADALERAAGAANKLATPKELAQYVSEVIGDEISQQREAVRNWLARSEVSLVGVPPAPFSRNPSVSSVSSVSMPAREPTAVTEVSTPESLARLAAAREQPRSRAGLVLGLIAVVLVLCIGAFVVFKMSATPPATAQQPERGADLAAPAATPSPAKPAETEQAPAASSEPKPSESVTEDTPKPTRTRPSSRPSNPGPGPKSKDDLPSNPYR